MESAFQVLFRTILTVISMMTTYADTNTQVGLEPKKSAAQPTAQLSKGDSILSYMSHDVHATSRKHYQFQQDGTCVSVLFDNHYQAAARDDNFTSTNN